MFDLTHHNLTPSGSALLRVFRLCVYCFLLLVFSTISYAHNSTVLVLLDSTNKHQMHFLTTLQQQTQSSKDLIFKRLDSSETTNDKIDAAAPTLIINLDATLGVQLISSDLNVPVWHALMALTDVKKFAPCLPRCSNIKTPQRFFVLDQNPERQISLVHSIMPLATNVSIMYTIESEFLLARYQLAARKQAINLSTHLVDSTSLRYQVEQIAQSSDVILALADKNIYNKNTLSQILLTSYRNRTPIIGFSKGFIKAGAISGVISSFDQLAQHLSSNITRYHVQQRLPNNELIFPKYFEVMSNQNVAKSLNLQFPGDAELTEQLQKNDTVQ